MSFFKWIKNLFVEDVNQEQFEEMQENELKKEQIPENPVPPGENGKKK